MHTSEGMCLIAGIRPRFRQKPAGFILAWRAFVLLDACPRKVYTLYVSNYRSELCRRFVSLQRQAYQTTDPAERGRLLAKAREASRELQERSNRGER